MGIFFTFENYTKYHNYLILSVISLLFFYLFYGINYLGGFKSFLFFEKQEEYSKQFIIHQIFCYFGIAIMSYLFYKKVDKQEEDKSFHIEDYYKIASDKKTRAEIVYSYAKEQNISYSFFMFIIFCWVFLDQAVENKFIGFFPNMDFWMLELIIMTILNAKIFKTNIYRHHWFVLCFNLFPILFKIITIYHEFTGSEPTKTDEGEGLKPLYVVHWYFIFIGIIIYLCLITLRAYVYIQLKCFMDLKYVSPNKLLLIYGLTGSILYSSICIITTFIKCGNSSIYDYICPAKNDNNDKYFANFILYLK